jgi:arylsulfatase A
MEKNNFRKPNIVFILADDLGYGDLGCYGATKVKTPNIDKISEQGIKFTDAHSPSAVCSPSRYNLLTGRYCWRTWAKTGCIWANDPLVIEQDQTTIASLLKEEGYKTGIVGKWHLGFGNPNDEEFDDLLGIDYNNEIKPGPTEVGFDYFYGYHGVPQEPNVFIENGKVVGLDPDDPIILHYDPRPEFDADYLNRPRTDNVKLTLASGKSAVYDFEDAAINLTKKAVSFIEENQDNPFFLYFAERNIHVPIKPNKRFVGTSDCGLYGDFIHELDWSVGEILDTLDRLGLSDNTLVIFSSDNGAVSEGHQPAAYVNYDGHMACGPLRGQKTEIWEGGHRVPFLAKWPGMIKPGTISNEMIAFTDMLATFAAIHGRELLNEEGPDSFSILPVLLGEETDEPVRENLVNDSHKGLYSIRQGPWKLIFGKGGGGLGWSEEDKKQSQSYMQLYNLEEDLQEKNNLVDKHPDIVQKLVNRFDEIKNSGHSR